MNATAASSEGPGRSAERTRDLERQFLPAALEITESPPSPTARVLLWAIVGFLVVGVLWSVLGRVDIVAVAPGRIVPSDRVKVIQPMVTSAVRAIHVRDGQAVRAGQPLIELDATLADAERDRAAGELVRAEAELTRHRAFVAALDGRQAQAADFARFGTADGSPGVMQHQLLRQALDEYRAKLATLDQSLDRRRFELQASTRTVDKHRQTLPLITQRAQSLKQLASDNLVAQNTYLELEEQRIAAEQDLATQEANLGATQAAIAELSAQRRLLAAESRREALAAIAELERHVSSLRQEQIKTRQLSVQQVLSAPVDGVVQQLKVHTVGGVVTPAEALMIVVPGNEGIEVEALVLNRDIGWVRGSQQARVKVEAFPFTRYGTVAGQVVSVSEDAITDEQLGLVYAARVRLAANQMRIDDKWVALSPGMAVSVEVRTGTRRLIEYFLSPAARAADESIRER